MPLRIAAVVISYQSVGLIFAQDWNFLVKQFDNRRKEVYLCLNNTSFLSFHVLCILQAGVDSPLHGDLSSGILQYSKCVLAVASKLCIQALKIYHVTQLPMRYSNPPEFSNSTAIFTVLFFLFIFFFLFTCSELKLDF